MPKASKAADPSQLFHVAMKIGGNEIEVHGTEDFIEGMLDQFIALHTKHQGGTNGYQTESA